MTRRRLALALTAAVAGLSSLALPAARASEPPTVAVPTATWACVHNDQLRIGVCLSNPFQR